MRLLIADDDRALALFLSRGLEADGHRVRLVHDGAAAEKAFLEEMPDLTILDLNMPVKDGEQVLEAVRAVDGDLPILILTARQEMDTGAQQAEAGFEDPALGWVSVRANGGVAGVHPALIPSSAEAAQVLAGHLAGLNSFLANRSPGVGDVIVASPESGASGMGTQAGSGQGSHEQHREGAAQEANSTMTLGAGADNRSGSSISRQLEPNLASGVSAATLQAPGAAHISVMV